MSQVGESGRDSMNKDLGIGKVREARGQNERGKFVKDRSAREGHVRILNFILIAKSAKKKRLSEACRGHAEDIELNVNYNVN